jgi:hypothetical protein
MFFKFCKINESPDVIVQEWKSQTLLFSFFVSIMHDETVIKNCEIFDKLNTFSDSYDWGKIGITKKYFMSFVEEHKAEAFKFFESNRGKGKGAFIFSSAELRVIIDSSTEVKDYLCSRMRKRN